eukprot:CAMPEP_0176034856 /NCGR_PEP_ID=MMETSP0120_2-20121206/17233_1 /TAXON_ID=160619 /ORGANISM="Kryptoperidinium foliaceum, Strain CCMP 1326" /LENGTH=187 /DNA_ID=CAMNT_0017368199 /DNA_START=24 /DNA_END=585 /DNA_ORIENTATION=+
MTLFYLMNWKDDDIRRFSWSILNTTISIFTAVMVFSAVESYLLHVLTQRGNLRHGSPLFPVLPYVLFLFWFIAMRIALSWNSHAWRMDADQGLEEVVWTVADPLLAQFGDRVPVRSVRKQPRRAEECGRDRRHGGLRREVAEELRAASPAHALLGTLYAHMTGFAAMKAGGVVQQSEAFRGSPWMSF